MSSKLFDCEVCGARGKIMIRTEHPASECVYCPVCSADIWEEEDNLDTELDK